MTTQVPERDLAVRGMKSSAMLTDRPHEVGHRADAGGTEVATIVAGIIQRMIVETRSTSQRPGIPQCPVLRWRWIVWRLAWSGASLPR